MRETLPLAGEKILFLRILNIKNISNFPSRAIIISKDRT